MKIATWNVNSIKARLPRVLEWLGEFSPDVVLLQELKCVEEAFPAMEIGDAGSQTWQCRLLDVVNARVIMHECIYGCTVADASMQQASD